MLSSFNSKWTLFNFPYQTAKEKMVSLRFPFSFPQPPKPPRHSFLRPSYAAAVAVGGAAAAVGFVAATRNSTNPQNPFLESALNLLFSNHSSPLWASLSLADNSAASSVVDSKTGFSFPSVIGDSQQLLGIGLRRKAILGLKNINVYAFGMLSHIFTFEELCNLIECWICADLADGHLWFPGLRRFLLLLKIALIRNHLGLWETVFDRYSFWNLFLIAALARIWAWKMHNIFSNFQNRSNKVKKTKRIF